MNKIHTHTLLSSMAVCEHKELALHQCPQLHFQNDVGDELVNFRTTDSWLQLTLNHTQLQIADTTAQGAKIIFGSVLKS